MIGFLDHSWRLNMKYLKCFIEMPLYWKFVFAALIGYGAGAGWVFIESVTK